jgi:V8-like Glu-specific endopeptidase
MDFKILNSQYEKFMICLFTIIGTLLFPIKVIALSFSPFLQSFPIEIQKANGVVVCSSVAVHPHLILTAAHCVEGAQTINLVAGHNLDSEHLRYNALLWTTHPEYNPSKSNFHYDVAKIILKNPLPKSLPYKSIGRAFEDKSLVRVGFGRREGRNTRTLISGQKVLYRGYDYFEMEDEFGYMGDSGGPLFQWQEGSYVLVGIHSTREGKNKTYAVYPFIEF